MTNTTSTPWLAPTPHTLALLQVLQRPGIGVTALRKYTGVFSQVGRPSPDLFAEASITGADAPPDAEYREAEDLARRIIDRCRHCSVLILSPADRAYPQRLRDIEDYPPILYVKGNCHALNSRPAIAVVGTRHPSSLGQQWSRKIAQALALNGFTTVSGLALGIDGAAHEGSLDAGGHTIAVLAHGLDTISPLSHTALAERILQEGGALVAEHAPGTPSHRSEFVRRNRLLSGLALATIVVETSPNDGGATHAARFTVSQGRALFAATRPRELALQHGYHVAGSQRLISEFGARPLVNQEQLLKELKALRSQTSLPIAKLR